MSGERGSRRWVRTNATNTAVGRRTRVVQFFFGAGSRYSYLAATQIPDVVDKTGAQFIWRAVYKGDCLDDPSFLRRYHILCMYGVQQSQRDRAHEKISKIKWAVRFLAASGGLLFLSVAVPAFLP